MANLIWLSHQTDGLFFTLQLQFLAQPIDLISGLNLTVSPGCYADQVSSAVARRNFWSDAAFGVCSKIKFSLLKWFCGHFPKLHLITEFFFFLWVPPKVRHFKSAVADRHLLLRRVRRSRLHQPFKRFRLNNLSSQPSLLCRPIVSEAARRFFSSAAARQKNWRRWRTKIAR